MPPRHQPDPAHDVFANCNVVIAAIITGESCFRFIRRSVTLCFHYYTPVMGKIETRKGVGMNLVFGDVKLWKL